MLPAEVRRLSPLLEHVDRWLDDEVFFAPFREHFSALFGRPSIPVEVYLRMMFLKFQYRMGYESLCREVGLDLVADLLPAQPRRVGAGAVDTVEDHHPVR